MLPLQECPTFQGTKKISKEPIRENQEPPYSNSLDEGEACFLHLDVPNFRVVAKATRYPRSSTIHNKIISEDQVKVSVSAFEAREATTDIPFPIDEVSKLGEAIGYFILWPKRLVFDTKIMSCGENFRKYPSLEALHDSFPTLPNKIDFQMAPGVVGPDKMYTFGFVPSDVIAFLSMEDLDLGWLELAIQ